MTEDILSGLLRREQAASAMGVSIATLAKWVREGRLRPVQLGRKQYIRQAELSALIQQGSRGATA